MSAPGTLVKPVVAAVPALPPKPAVHPLLAAYLLRLATRPLLTKCITSGTLGFFQEILAVNLANARPSPQGKSELGRVLAKAGIDSRALKLAAYGFFISAPMGHTLVGLLQKTFQGRTSTGAKVAQIVASNALVAPIQTVVYLSATAIINGAKTVQDVIKTVKLGFFPMIRITWITSPLALIVAQNYLSPELWVPYFNLISFILGTYFNMRAKKQKALLDAKKREGKDL